jgi:hypothetical protein
MLDEKRQRRLEQMRQSQQKLRMRKAERFNLLESEIEALKQENAKLEKENATLKDCEMLQHHTLTNVELKKMVEDYSPKVGETIPLVEFTATNNVDHKWLYKDQEFILVSICKKEIECLEGFISQKEVLPLTNQSFKYLGMYGRSLPSLYYAQIKAVVDKKIPTNWLNCTFIPRNTIGITEVFAHLNTHLKPDHINFQVLTFALARYFCATPFGPVITKEELDKAIDLSYNPKLDLFYLLGTLQVQLCDVPESLVDSLVK